MVSLEVTLTLPHKDTGETNQIFPVITKGNKAVLHQVGS
jgi:hypothetical protein